MAAKHGYAAFAPEDVDDAKRGHPDVDLTAYAASRSLEPLGSTLVAAVRAVQPVWTEYIFNAVRGVLPGGSFGVVEHELYEVETHASSGIMFPGAFYGSRYTAKGPKGFWNKVLPFEISVDVPNEPFAASAAWVPVTTVALRVPEAALLPRLLVRRSDRMGRLGNTSLDGVGLGGYQLAGSQVPPGLVAAIFGSTVGQVLGSLPYPFVEVLFAYGTLALRCNGYLRDEAALDGLAVAACAIADGLRAAAAPFHAPRSFEVALEPAQGGPPQWAPWYPVVNEAWIGGFKMAAERHGLVLEEPADLHRAMPRLPLPGTAQGVLRGNLPGTTAPGRLVFTGQGGTTEGQVRACGLVPAPPDAPSLRVGGLRVQETDMFVEIVDGVIACWNRERSASGMDTTELAQRILATAQVALHQG